MEIERKFLIKQLPGNLSDYSSHLIEQGYLCTQPVLRIRRQDDSYIFTYKSKGMLAREEYNLPLTAESYQHLKSKVDGNLISKRRYLIPLNEHLTVELDVFSGMLEGLMFAEVEFSSEEEANAFIAPDWLGLDVTFDKRYHNSYLSTLQENEIFWK